MSAGDRRLNIMSGGDTSSKKATFDEPASAKDEEYCIRKDDSFMMEFNGATSARKSLAKGAGFVRHPFQFVELDSVELTDNKYMIGPFNNEEALEPWTSTWPTKDKLYPSSSSSTQIFDDPNIPALKALRVVDHTKQIMPVDFTEPRVGTLENLLLWAHNLRNDSVAFIFQVQIDNIRTWNGWNFPMCGGENCKKGVGRKLEGWWCDSCEKAVEYPVLRYRLELGISDGTTYVVVVMFDKTASELVKAQPTHLRMPMKSFTYSKLIPPEEVAESAGSSTIDAVPDAPRSLGKRLCKQPSVSTPLKPSEGKTPIRQELEDSDADSLPVRAGGNKKQRVSKSE
ncbi:nucleic acid-binding, OB-fold protein [Tanacetum coccineum]